MISGPGGLRVVAKTDLTPGGFGTAFGVHFPGLFIGAATDTAVAITTYFAEVNVPWPVSIQGVGYWVGTAQAGLVRSALYDAAGTRLAKSTAGEAQSATFIRQVVEFDAPVAVPAGTYFAALGFTSATAKAMFAGLIGGGGSTATGAGDPPATIVPSDAPGVLAPLPAMTLA